MKWIWVIFFGLLVSQLQADVVSELARCDVIKEPSVRLDCLNQVVDRHRPPPKAPTLSGRTPVDSTPNDVTVINQPSVHTAPGHKTYKNSIEEDPATKNTNAPAVNIDQPDWDKPKSKTAKEMRATIVAVRKLSRGQYVLTLSNGQVWREIEARRQSRYSVGDEIIIRRAFGGSYNLKSNATGYRNKARRVE